MSKICIVCQQDKSTEDYHQNNDNQTKINLTCKRCLRDEENKRISNFRKTDRRLVGSRSKYIVDDSKKYDRKNKLLGFNLTVEFVDCLIKDGCSYCLVTEAFMSLDRIDNSKGHSKNNVVSCCYRCNLMRRDVPWAAWCRMLPKIQEIQEQGLFGDWYSKPISHK